MPNFCLNLKLDMDNMKNEFEILYFSEFKKFEFKFINYEFK